MIQTYVLTFLIASLALGTLITMSSTHWLLAWVGLEINYLALLPLTLEKYNHRSVEAAMKYFLIQVTASSTLLFASATNAWMFGTWNIQQTDNPIIIAMIFAALALKLGLAPFHAWFPEILQGLTLPTCMLLSTWQKLAPLYLLIQLPANCSVIITSVGLLSIMVGGWGCLNQTQLKKIMGYSAIAHFGWMILVIQQMPELTSLAFMVYVILTSTMFLVFWYNETDNIISLSISWTKMPIILAVIPLILMSLGGLPPLTGFFPKWMVLLELTKHKLLFTASMAALLALLALFFYVHLSFALAIAITPSILPELMPWRMMPSHPFNY
uniref:NADH-ubiquinone oxidoreductase chain 2 n=1 Tax=Pterolebias phasianus TaxID=60344 RepID=Q9TD10_9TELE|nr:NADH dehydrogenase subunit II [Pterolebias phasianus]